MLYDPSARAKASLTSWLDSSLSASSYNTDGGTFTDIRTRNHLLPATCLSKQAHYSDRRPITAGRPGLAHRNLPNNSIATATGESHTWNDLPLNFGRISTIFNHLQWSINQQRRWPPPSDMAHVILEFATRIENTFRNIAECTMTLAIGPW